MLIINGEELAKKIDDVTAVAADPGNSHADDYLRGMANGLLLAQSIVHGTEPVYIEADVIERFDYMAEADKTCSVIFNPQNVDRDAFYMLLDRMASDARQLNIAKKLLFRGKSPVEVGTSEPALHESLAVEFDPNNPVTGEIDLLHGIVGVLTEAGEMAEVLLHRLNTGAFDNVNAFEEVGDVTWYLARQLRGLGTTFETSNRANIDKLHGRHGNAFDVFRDANRDLHAERERLETAAPLFEHDVPLSSDGFPVTPEHDPDGVPKQFTHAPMHYDETVGEYARRMTGADTYAPSNVQSFDAWETMLMLAKKTQQNEEALVNWFKAHWPEDRPCPADAMLKRYAADARSLHPLTLASDEGCEPIVTPADAPTRPAGPNVGTKARRDPPGTVERFERTPLGDCEGTDC